MPPLIETIIAFSAILIIVSLLVEVLTSAIRNHFDFYSRVLEREVYSLLEGTIEISRKQLQERTARDPALRAKLSGRGRWKRLGEEYLTKENIIWVLMKLDPQKVTDEAIKDLEGRLAVHVANAKHMFDRRVANLTLAVGLALCLFCNINMLTIWDKIYNDVDVRSKFSSAEVIDSAMKLKMQLTKDIKSLPEGKEKDELRKQRRAAEKQFRHFQGQVGFGIGKIWTEYPKRGEAGWFLLVEFLGSLLTGIVASLGAPYWRGILGILTGFPKGNRGKNR